MRARRLVSSLVLSRVSSFDEGKGFVWHETEIQPNFVAVVVCLVETTSREIGCLVTIELVIALQAILLPLSSFMVGFPLLSGYSNHPPSVHGDNLPEVFRPTGIILPHEVGSGFGEAFRYLHSSCYTHKKICAFQCHAILRSKLSRSFCM